MKTLLIPLFSLGSIFLAPFGVADGGKSGDFVYFENGRLYLPDGEEMALYGVNLQPCLSWEYNSLFKLVGIPLDTEILKRSTDKSLDEIQKMNCDVIRAHLVPSDFTDNNGNLVETVYLDQLDYMVAEAAKRGMYVYLTFLNPHMSYDIDVEDPSKHSPSHVADTFINDYERKDLYCDKEFIQKSKVYLKDLLNRKNPYLKTTYKDTPAIALWEIANEPLFYSYEEVRKTKHIEDYLAWVKKEGREDSPKSYSNYRHDQVLNYINGMYDTIRETGAVQPIVWNCNWHLFIRGNEEVFDAIGKSKVEVVSFCNYPGQSVVKKPYTKNPIDLSRHDFSSFLRNSYKEKDWYRWALRPDFKKKAKVVYEFETFYNYSGYLYPAQALFFRAMGVQSATMWHYSMPDYAPYRNGSHHLSWTSTPHKAASYAVAAAVFRNTPLYHDFDTESPTERSDETILISYEKDLSVFSSKDLFVHSGEVSASETTQPLDGVRRIIGFQSSPVVQYSGTGCYNVEVGDDQIRITIEPNAKQLKPLWGKGFLKEPVVELDYKSPHPFKLKIEGWNAGDCTLYRIEGGERTEISFSGGKLQFDATPGEYLITK